VRRLAPFAVLLVLLVGCSSVPGGKKTASPVADTVIGKLKLPKPPPVGDAANGLKEFTKAGCGACHIFKPAGAAAIGKVGPDLDNLAAYAKTANQGTLAQFTSASITSPDDYVAPGYTAGLMPKTYSTSLTPQQVADITAFLVKGP
jgi:cytochrome c